VSSAIDSKKEGRVSQLKYNVFGSRARRGRHRGVGTSEPQPRRRRGRRITIVGGGDKNAHVDGKTDIFVCGGVNTSNDDDDVSTGPIQQPGRVGGTAARLAGPRPAEASERRLPVRVGCVCCN
jgi:hypothetical protein